MKCRKINEIHYLRTFEAAEAVKSYRASLWTDNNKALGALTLGMFFGSSFIAWKAFSSELRIFDLIKNISFYKELDISPKSIEALSTVVSLGIGLVAAVSAVVFQINKAEQFYLWENRAEVLLGRIDSHIMLNQDQVMNLLWRSPWGFRNALSKYTVLRQSFVEETNNLERVALEKLLKVIVIKAHMNLAEAYDAALNQCKGIVNDQRVIEAFLKDRLKQETLKPIKLFAEYCHLKNLQAACLEDLPNPSINGRVRHVIK